MSTKTNIPKPPDWLTERACTIYMEVFKTLGSQGLPSDCSVVADFAQALADCELWSAIVRFEGEVLKSERTGCLYPHPMYSHLTARRHDVERLRKDLGMTPKARGVAVKSVPQSGLLSSMGA